MAASKRDVFEPDPYFLGTESSRSRIIERRETSSRSRKEMRVARLESIKSWEVKNRIEVNGVEGG